MVQIFIYVCVYLCDGKRNVTVTFFESKHNKKKCCAHRSGKHGKQQQQQQNLLKVLPDAISIPMEILTVAFLRSKNINVSCVKSRTHQHIYTCNSLTWFSRRCIGVHTVHKRV